MQTKICYRCRVPLPVDSFGPERANKDGLKGKCRKCFAALARESRKADPSYLEAQNERRIARRVSGNRFPSEALSQRQPQSAAERSASMERWSFGRRVALARKQADRFGAPVNDLTLDDWLEVLQQYSRSCAYCGIDDEPMWIDHYVPLARGGHNTKNNVVPSCEDCNRRKSKRSAEQFLNNLCHRDHPLWGDNLYIYPDGVKFACRTCRQSAFDRHDEKRGRQRRKDA